MKIKIRTLLFVSFFLAYSQHVFALWPKVVEPPQSTLNKMADEIFINGIAVQIIEFNSRLSIRQILSFYKNKWSDKFAESESGEWQQISRMGSKYFTTIQIKDNGYSGTTGRISIWKFPQKAPVYGRKIPMMRDTRILNEVVTKDKLSISTVALLSNSYSIDDNMNFYENFYNELDWKTIISEDLREHGITLVFKKDTEEASITIKSIKGSGGSSIVINKVKKRSWFN